MAAARVLPALTYVRRVGFPRVHMVSAADLTGSGPVLSLCGEVEAPQEGWALATQQETEGGMCWLCHRAFLRVIRAGDALASKEVEEPEVLGSDRGLMDCWRCGGPRAGKVYGEVVMPSGSKSRLAMCLGCADQGPWPLSDLDG